MPLQERIKTMQILIEQVIAEFRTSEVDSLQEDKIRGQVNSLMQFVTPIVIKLKDQKMEYYFEQQQLYIIKQTIKAVAFKLDEITEHELPNVFVESLKEQIMKEKNPSMFLGAKILVEETALSNMSLD